MGINLLHNAYWVAKECIINQRGQEAYNTNGYCIDRWILWDANTTLEITGNGLHVYRNSHTGGAPITHKFEQNSLAPGVYTLSVLSTNGVERLNYYIEGVGDIFNDSDTDKELATHTFTIPETVKDKNHWVSTEGKYGSILRAAKLEPGSVQTLAHKDANGNWVLNDPPPDYGLELLKCQRYQVIVDGEANGIMGRIESTGSNISLFMPTPVQMRANPTVKIKQLKITGDGGLATTWDINTSGIAMPTGIQVHMNLSSSAGLAPYQSIFCDAVQGYSLDSNL